MPAPSIQEMQADLHTAQANGDNALANHISQLIHQAQTSTPQGRAYTAGQHDRGGQGGLVAGIQGAADAGSFGTYKYLAAGMRSLGQLATTGHADDYGNNLAYVQGLTDQTAQDHPGAHTAGEVGGAVLGAAATAPVAAAQAGRLGLVAKAGQPVLNTLRAGGAAALAGGEMGAVTGATHGQQAANAQGQDAGQQAQAAATGAAQDGTLGAATGGALGAASVPAGALVSQAAKAAQPLATKTAMALAKVFGEDPSDLQAAWKAFQQSTGRPPTMAELASLKQRGAILKAAKDSTPITTALSDAAEDAARARSVTMQDTVTDAQAPQQVGPAAQQSSGEIQNATTAGGDRDFGAARQHNFTVDTQESEALGGVSPADHLASEVLPLAGLGRADRVRILGDLQNGGLSGEDAQLIRSNLGRAQGTGANYSPAIASAQADLEHALSGPGNETANAALQQANQNYVAGAQRGTGAQHGESITGTQTAPNFAAEAASKANVNGNFQAGMASGARTKLAAQAATPTGATSLAKSFATDDNLHQKLATTFGPDVADSLRRLGQAETGAADNLAPFAKRTPQVDDQDSKDMNTALRAMATFASHGVYQFYHGAKAIAGLGMSPKVQETVARYLADPKMTVQGINLLRKAGATNAQMRQLVFDAAKATGATGANIVTSAAASSAAPPPEQQP